MNCKNCGAALAADDKFCKNCGTAVAAQPTESAQPVAADPIAMNPVAAQPAQNMAAPVAPAPKQDGGLKMIILGIVAVVAVVAAVLITMMVMSGDEKKPADDGTGNVTPSGVEVPAVSTHKVRYQGFSMEVPDDVFTEEYSSYLALMDSSDEWIATLEIAEGSFTRIKANKSQLPALMQQGGYTCTDPKQQTLGGVEYVTTEATISGQVATIGVAAAGSSDFMVLTVVNAYNEVDYSILEKLAPIAKSIKRESYSNKVTIDNRLNLDDFKEIAK